MVFLFLLFKVLVWLYIRTDQSKTLGYTSFAHMSEPKGDFQRSRLKEVALSLAHLLGALLGLGADLSAGLGGLLVADFVGDLPADGLRVVNLDGVAVGHPPLHVGDGADGRAGNVVAVAAGGAHWDRVAVLLGHPVAPGAATVLVLLLLLLLPPLLLVPEGGGPLASVAPVALPLCPS